MDELIKYAQRITLNDISDKSIEIATLKLLYSMFSQCKDRNELMEFFKMNFTNSEKSPFAKDLILEWAVTK